jgi:serine/threonine-protein kinase
LVFIGRRAGSEQIYVRQLDRDEARALPGTESVRTFAVSTDGQWVAFWAKGALKKIPLAGGPVVEIAPNVPDWPFGLAWDDRSNLYFTRGDDGRICRAQPADGLDVISLDDDYVPGSGGHILPSVVPKGNVLLYTLRKRPHIGWGDEEIVAQVLATGKRKTLLKDAADARYVPTGHLVFMRRGRLFGVAFDPERVETRGAEMPLVDGVAQALVVADAIDCTGRAVCRVIHRNPRVGPRVGRHVSGAGVRIGRSPRPGVADRRATKELREWNLPVTGRSARGRRDTEHGR